MSRRLSEYHKRGSNKHAKDPYTGLYTDIFEGQVWAWASSDWILCLASTP